MCCVRRHPKRRYGGPTNPKHRPVEIATRLIPICDLEVFPLAVLILDNYLTIENILLRDVQVSRDWIWLRSLRPPPLAEYHLELLQGIAAACMLMASKMKAPTPINAARLSFFTENSVSAIQIVVSCCCFALFFLLLLLLF